MGRPYILSQVTVEAAFGVRSRRVHPPANAAEHGLMGLDGDEGCESGVERRVRVENTLSNRHKHCWINSLCSCSVLLADAVAKGNGWAANGSGPAGELSGGTAELRGGPGEFP